MVDKVLLFIAPIIGIVIAYVDSRPTWDDTGITVFALLACSGLLALFIPRRPWLWALAIGLWIPLWGILHAHNFSMLFVLIFPFVGAYAGWAVRRILPKRIPI